MAIKREEKQVRVIITDEQIRVLANIVNCFRSEYVQRWIANGFDDTFEVDYTSEEIEAMQDMARWFFYKT